MQDKTAWSQIEKEAAGAFLGPGHFPVPAYSEFMPPPFVGLKPFTACDAGGAAVTSCFVDQRTTRRADRLANGTNSRWPGKFSWLRDA